ncbi:MAG: oxygen-independent coproporphyrinogen III oxidase [Myxococcota bacterium]|jgi:oxygen-independent coproporphyrinogen-3 oxidase|nr:oxygen-independent coproporphyrinogen III oxidase [Myxococcota bacterium]
MRITPELLARYDRPGPRYTSYPTAVDFSPVFDAAAYERALQRLEGRPEPLALYAHIPFCAQRCAYCGCTTACSQGAELNRYLQALLRELELLSERLGAARRLAQLHWGGGTPAALGTRRLLSLHDAIRERFELLPDAEQAFEADPRHTPHALLEGLAARGFERISFGVQDFDALVQEAIGRRQSYEQVAKVLAAARSSGFRSVNFDLVYGLPGQTLESFERSLELVTALRPERLAVYSFAYLPHLRENQRALDASLLPSPALKLELLACAHQRLLSAGYVAIGIDHFALPTDELAQAAAKGRLSRSFMGYSPRVAPHWLGLGASAIGYVEHCYAQNHHDVEQYQAAIEAGGFATLRGYALSEDDQLRAEVIRELLCNFRLDYALLESKYHIDFAEYFSPELVRLREMQDEGLLTLSADGLVASELGRTFARNLAMVFDRYLKRHEEAGRFSRTV